MKQHFKNIGNYFTPNKSGEPIKGLAAIFSKQFLETYITLW